MIAIKGKFTGINFNKWKYSIRREDARGPEVGVLEYDVSGWNQSKMGKWKLTVHDSLHRIGYSTVCSSEDEALRECHNAFGRGPHGRAQNWEMVAI